MSKVFRARFVEALRKQTTVSAELAQKLFAKKWVVYTKQPFYGSQQVIEYLGRYTHKIAISNHRIQDIRDDSIWFSAKDYKRGGRKVQCVLSEKEFIRRFSLHILPKEFTRIRHYGILSSTSKSKNKALIDNQLGKIVSAKLQKGTLHKLCPSCKKGQLKTIALFDQRGPPDHWLGKLKQA